MQEKLNIPRLMCTLLSIGRLRNAGYKIKHFAGSNGEGECIAKGLELMIMPNECAVGLQ